MERQSYTTHTDNAMLMLMDAVFHPGAYQCDLCFLQSTGAPLSVHLTNRRKFLGRLRSKDATELFHVGLLF